MPKWLKNRLESIGISPTNNIVDITNYILRQMSPSYMLFDLKNIEGNKIIVSSVEQDTNLQL